MEIFSEYIRNEFHMYFDSKFNSIHTRCQVRNRYIDTVSQQNESYIDLEREWRDIFSTI